MSRVKDFNTVNPNKWLRPPTLSCSDNLIIAQGIIPKGKKLNVVLEFFYGIEPIHYLDNEVVHWNLDFSKCFSFKDGKNKEIPYEKWIHSICS